MTLKDNILFSKNLNKDKYEQVLDACALVDDLKILAGGDQIEIGERVSSIVSLLFFLSFFPENKSIFQIFTKNIIDDFSQMHFAHGTNTQLRT